MSLESPSVDTHSWGAAFTPAAVGELEGGGESDGQRERVLGWEAGGEGMVDEVGMQEDALSQ